MVPSRRCLSGGAFPAVPPRFLSPAVPRVLMRLCVVINVRLNLQRVFGPLVGRLSEGDFARAFDAFRRGWV